VTLRVVGGIESLREPSLFSVVRRALAEGKRHFGFSVVHFSVQRDHVHIIAEANDRRALSRGMQGLSIRVARAVNAQLGRSGKLFADRYHARALTSPRTVRLALRYVLLNVRKHFRSPQGPAEASVKSRTESPRGPQGPAEASVKSRTESPRGPQALAEPSGFVDRCSSAPWFSGFARPAELAFGARAAREDWRRVSGSSQPPIVRPQSWLLRVGWQRAGAFDIDETPG
jgi:REP element-mobilizing transposase RayT